MTSDSVHQPPSGSVTKAMKHPEVPGNIEFVQKYAAENLSKLWWKIIRDHFRVDLQRAKDAEDVLLDLNDALKKKLQEGGFKDRGFLRRWTATVARNMAIDAANGADAEPTAVCRHLGNDGSAIDPNAVLSEIAREGQDGMPRPDTMMMIDEIQAQITELNRLVDQKLQGIEPGRARTAIEHWLQLESFRKIAAEMGVTKAYIERTTLNFKSDSVFREKIISLLDAMADANDLDRKTGAQPRVCELLSFTGSCARLLVDAR